MKKFIAAFDGLSFSESTMSYAIFLAKHCEAHLVGVFLEDFTRHSYSMADITAYEGSNLDRHMQELNEKDREERDKSISIFEQACQSGGIHYSVHRDRNIAIHELLHESIYADLLIISASESLTRYEEPAPSRFVRSLLNDVQCPVVVVPAVYKSIDKIILLYDGEPSSVHAVRMFSYLFEPIKHFDTEVISVKSAPASLHLPDNRLIREFIKRHYPKAEYVVLKGLAEDEIIRYLLLQKQHPMIVLGAYQRSRFSRLFRPSMADHLLLHLKMPLFIAHNKS
jgi:nucleotide-binding universal stress UspA family protein